MSAFEVHHGDALEVLRTLDAASVHACVTDPPYGLGSREPSIEEIVAYLSGADLDTGGDFMGKNWQIPPVAVWREVFRILKPGGHLLAFGGTRTFDLIALGIRAAGFQFRDTISNEGVLRWYQGMGFPKSLNVSAAIDRAAGAERKVVGSKRLGGNAGVSTKDKGGTYGVQVGTAPAIDVPITEAATEEAKRWEGWGTALKPSWEPVLVFRKPFSGTVAANVVEHGAGALNIDACRVGTSKAVPASAGGGDFFGLGTENMNGSGADPNVGRWPANATFVHLPECERAGTKTIRGSAPHGPNSGNGALGRVNDDGWKPKPRVAQEYSEGGTETVEAWRCGDGCPVAELDAQSGDRPSGVAVLRNGGGGRVFGHGRGYSTEDAGYSDSGGASRFFFCSKASTSERTENVGENKHVSVKPLALMRWLVKLVCPKDGLVLDCYAGSGTTGVAAIREGLRFVGIERDAEYADLARRRVNYALGPLFAAAGGSK